MDNTILNDLNNSKKELIDLLIQNKGDGISDTEYRNIIEALLKVEKGITLFEEQNKNNSPFIMPEYAQEMFNKMRNNI